MHEENEAAPPEVTTPKEKTSTRELITKSKIDLVVVVVQGIFILFNVVFPIVPLVWFLTDSCKNIEKCLAEDDIPYDLLYLVLSLLTSGMSIWASYIGIKFLFWKIMNKEQVRYMQSTIPQILSFCLTILCEFPCMVFLSTQWRSMLPRITASIVHIMVHAIVLIVFLVGIILRRLDPTTTLAFDKGLPSEQPAVATEVPSTEASHAAP
jgi:hypothetical protein